MEERTPETKQIRKIYICKIKVKNQWYLLTLACYGKKKIKKSISFMEFTMGLEPTASKLGLTLDHCTM